MNTRGGTKIPTGRSMADEAVRRGAIDLAQGVMHASPPPVLLTLLHELSAKRRSHIYTSPYGVEAYRQALVDLLHGEGATGLSLGNVVGTTGVTGGLMATLISQLQPGDGVLLLEPFYPAHDWAIRAARCEPLYIRSTETFAPHWESLTDQVSRARAILISNPANPSGTIWTRSDLERLLGLAKHRDLLLIFDETYKDYVWEETYPSPLAVDTSLERTVVLRGFAKTLAISGWRVGYAIARAERAEEIIGVHDALYVGSPSLPQWVLSRALREHTAALDAFLNDARALYRENRMALAETFQHMGMEPHLPQGAFYMLAKHHRADDLAATRELLAAGVAVAPGGPFFSGQRQDTGFIRLHFAVSRETVAEVRAKLLVEARTR